MPTANLIPTYYRVTWTGNSPTDYNATGGVDPTTAEQYNRIVRVTGTDSSVSVTNLHSIRINDVEVVFTTAGGLNLAGVISTINLLTSEHHVVAVESPSNYLTLMNATLWQGHSIWLAAGTGTALTDCGFSAGVFNKWPSVLGGSLNLPLTDGNNVKINNVTVTFVTGALDLAGVVATINASSFLHNVTALAAGASIQLYSNNGQPFLLAEGSAGTLTKIGFTAGVQGGTPTTLAQALNKERGNMRWEAVINQLGMLISPVFLGEYVKEGSLDGTGALTTLGFTVGYDRTSFLRVENVTSPGTYLTGSAAVRRLVATALVNTYEGNQEIFDPTVTNTGTSAVRVNPTQIIAVTADALAAQADIATLEAQISVVQLPQI